MIDVDAPHVLFIDDDELLSLRQLREILAPYDVETRIRTPEETIRSDIDWSDLVVIDYFLTNWPERDEISSVARAPTNGLAVAASVRSVLLPPLSERRPGAPVPRPVAFALWSGNLTEASFDLPEVVLPHVFSRENNLEWAFRRTDLLSADAGRQIALLATAVRTLPERWPLRDADAEVEMLRMLGLHPSDGLFDDDSWRVDACGEVLNCRPPLHELSARSHGLSLVRWILHRIFPYPCFLIDALQLKARLRVDSLDGGDAVVGTLDEVLNPYIYNGVLAGFDGPRWWRAGVEDWLFTATGGQSGSPRAVVDLARQYGAVASKDWLRPVVVIGPDLAPLPLIVEVEEALRVRPDDWPVFADDAFARLEDIRDDPRLQSLVDPADRPMLDPGSELEGRL